MSRAFLHLGGKVIIFPHKFQTKSAFFSEAKILVKSDLFTNKTTPKNAITKKVAHARRILDKSPKTLTSIKNTNKKQALSITNGTRLNTFNYVFLYDSTFLNTFAQKR